MTIEIKVADYSDQQQATDIIYLMDCYAKDKMGINKSLPSFVNDNLVNELNKIHHAITILCYVDNKPVGLINAFEGFSTFQCKPLINIHDVIVHNDFRGQGLSQLMLIKIEEIAKTRNCCKITLEVLAGNKPAQQTYHKFGFRGYELDPLMGEAIFWEKKLNNKECS